MLKMKLINDGFVIYSWVSMLPDEIISREYPFTKKDLKCFILELRAKKKIHERRWERFDLRSFLFLSIEYKGKSK